MSSVTTPGTGGGGGNFETDVNKILTGPSECLWFEDDMPLEVLVDQDGNVLTT